MKQLILIKHAMPVIEPDQPPDTWRLAPDGFIRAADLAEQLRPYQVEALVSSTELKARETAGVLGEKWGLAVDVMDGLHEHDRRQNAPYMQDVSQFHAQVARFFENPDELVFGLETANAAADRFERAVDLVLTRYPAQTIAIVTHGTVMSLFIARRNGIDPFPLWSSLKLPSSVALTLPDFRLMP